ncbi:MAG: hypothetical protein ACI85O_000679 [Saprospiraceae bacterium]|jgi:hypothetical protein
MKPMKSYHSSFLKNIGLVLLLTFLGSPFLTAQQLDYETRTTILLDDGTEVILFGEAVSHEPKANVAAKGNRYYYLPPANSLRLSTTANDDKPAFFLLKYAGNTQKDAMGGAIYFNMEFGLTKEKELEIEKKLRKKIRKPNARIMGSVPLLPEVGKTTGSFNVMMIKNGEKTTLQQSSAPVGQGGKLAVLGNLDRVTTELYEEILTDKNLGVAGLFVDLRYSYPIMVKSFTASMKFNSSRYHEVKDSISESYSRSKSSTASRIFTLGLGGSKESVTKEEFSEFYEELKETNVITQHSEAGMFSDPETTRELEKAFFDFFFNTFAQPSTMESAKEKDRERQEIDAPKMSMRNQSYDVNITEKSISKLERHSTFDFKHRAPYRFECSFSNDVRAMLQGVDLQKHIKTIILDDPLFAHRQINISLDARLSDLIGKAVNSVEIRLRKEKENGEYFYFEDQPPVLFNEAGQALQIRMYNRFNDKNTAVYDYKVKINYNGGKTEETKWRTGRWDQIVISPKLERRDIEFEADLTELKENNITRATLQIRYLQLGKEQTDKIDLSVSQSEGAELKTIFLDSGKKAYATRLILNHKKHGKIILPWQEIAFSDDYVFANIPESLKDEEELKTFKENQKVSFNDDRKIQNEDGTMTAEIKEEENEFGEKN